ncbi:tetratricopeptide repeat protein [Candidatus Microgenomates bacterium]|nr:MAG: tetratricopeptide repeat protein [Candidatus Microgenomates bacterium]
MEKNLQKIKNFILYSLLVIVPFFFLNITQEYFVTNKIYLLGFGILSLMLISVAQVLVSKKISWEKRPLDNFFMLFLTSMAISIVLSSPNKVQALLNPSFGLIMMMSLVGLYFYLSRSTSKHNFEEQSVKVISFILSLITIIFFFQPLKNVNLPQNFVFLKSAAFSPVGSQLDSVILLGFFLIIQIKYLLTKKRSILSYSSLTFNILAILLSVYSLLKPGTALLLPPFRLSWYAALEVLKNPQMALIGVGPDNFSAVFTRIKDFAYNQSPIWQINSFNVSRSVVLQIFTETGILGLLAFGLLLFSVLKLALKQSSYLMFYLLICIFVFPPSFIVWFLFFVLSAQIVQQQHDDEQMKQSIDLSGLLPIFIGFVVISVGLIGVSGYFLGRTFAAEYYFKKSLDGVTNNSVKQVYDNQRQAIILNPYIEKFRSSFAQTNLLIANNLAQKKPEEITEKDRQTITQAIQAGITEGKAVVSLNSQKAEGWQSLAAIYLNIINAATGADVWSVSAYQRAILADPQNPSYRVGIGGVYYYLKQYDEAIKFFEQAIALKPDWANSNYNYAWANFQAKNYSKAVNAMENTLNLLNPKTDKADYEKVKKELEEFKKMLPKDETVTPENTGEQSTAIPPSSLNLPTPPAVQISPMIELPKDASPEAK